MIYKKEAIELLKKGATIEYTRWGVDYPIYIRYKDRFERINRNSYNSICNNFELKLIYQKRLSCKYKLK